MRGTLNWSVSPSFHFPLAPAVLLWLVLVLFVSLFACFPVLQVPGGLFTIPPRVVDLNDRQYSSETAILPPDP